MYLGHHKVTFYALHDNFFFTQLACFFDSQKYSYQVHDDTEAFFLFLFNSNSDIFLGPFFAFCHFILKKILIFFAGLFLESFFVFLIIVICHLHRYITI